MKIVSLIAGIVCIVLALLLFLIGSVVGGIILLIIGAINLLLYFRQKNAPKKAESDFVSEYTKFDDFEFFVAGCDYNQEALSKLLTMKNEEYLLPKSKFLEEVFERCYQFDIEYAPAQLVDEPENEYDPNAIAVFVHDERIGYVAKKDQATVKSFDIDHAEVEIYGGKYKEPDGDEIIKGETPYKAKLHIYTEK